MASTEVLTRSRLGRRDTVGVGFDFDLAGVVQVGAGLERLLGDRIPWFQERAIQTLYRALPVEARRDIQAEYNIRAGRVREHMRTEYLRDGTARRAGVRLYGQWKRGIGLMQYEGTRQTRKGVTYSVWRGRRQLEAHAFITRLRQGDQGGDVAAGVGNQHVVLREGPKRQRTYRHRRNGKVYTGTRTDPGLVTQYRATVAQQLAKGRRPERLLDYSAHLLEREVRRQLDGYLRR